MKILSIDIEYENDAWLLIFTTVDDVFVRRAEMNKFVDLADAVRHHFADLENRQ